MRHACFVAGLLFGLAVPAASQTFQQAIDLSGLGNPLASAKPFGIRYEPVQDRLYVAIAGDFISNNHALAVIDPLTDLVLQTIDVGLFPEDIAFAYDSLGGFRYGAVSNSTDGSVSLWDANLQVVATIALPDPLGIGSSFPFGLTVLGDLLYVTTVDGSGEVYAIDLNTLSLAPAAGFQTDFRSGARAAAVGDAVWIPTTLYDLNFSGADAGLWIEDSQGTLPSDHLLVAARHDFGGYPSASAVLPHADGRAFLTGLDFGGRLLVLDGSGAPSRAIDLEGVDGYDLALSEDGTLLAVTGLAQNEIALVDLVNEVLWSRTQTTGLGVGYAQPNAVAFAHGKLYATAQADEAVLVFGQLPTVVDQHRYAGSLVIDNSAPAGGESVTATLQGIGSGQVALLLADTPMPSLLRGLSFDIGPSPRILAVANGSLQRSWTVPPLVQVPGRSFYLQGYLDDGGSDRLTRPAMIILQ